MRTVLETKNINKYFKKPVLFHVLSDISFKVSPGEFVSIMGKSGCGKSTLLYILSTMDTDYEGDLYLNDKLITGSPRDELSQLRSAHIGFVFQFHYLLAEFSVLDNVMLPAKKLGRKSIQEIEHDAIEKLRMLDIEKLALKKASRISGGEKQRVSIARSLINDPLIIMGDEPTGNLDSYNSELVFEIFKKLSDEDGLSLLIVTHDKDFASKTNRIIEMEDGKIIN
ncbi:ABC transporter ATP-binding protein [Gramella sp. KN1008]|uniref:ABC transporter ATP-binding protein n=1 Tax=Gramella sp. KN1008 TaxID=2529298 RepID=UPI00103B70E9|nr:ABC transporter ATP-binding protein [Gramella sp. KN1008]TBW26775.1 ABC transporter ATP-binding protein [Gramella sp. KN1008]